MRDEDVRPPRTVNREAFAPAHVPPQQDTDHIALAGPFPAAVVTTHEQTNFALTHRPAQYAAQGAAFEKALCSPVEAVVVLAHPAAERPAHRQAKQATVSSAVGAPQTETYEPALG